MFDTSSFLFIGSTVLTLCWSNYQKRNKNLPSKYSKYGFPNDLISHHIDSYLLEKMRYEIDDDGDELLRILSQHNPSILTCRPNKIHDYLKDIFINNDGAEQFDDASFQNYLKKYSHEPAWVDWNLLEKGQCVFLRYPTVASMALMYYSLIGGFAAPKIIKVLNSTGYLSKNTDATFHRLNETMDMVMKCLETPDSLRYRKAGWIAVTAVRLLHSRVRRSLLTSKNRWDTEMYGLPINQEDMMGTLLSFSINVLDSFKKVGVPLLTEEDEKAYIHFWRYIGYLIGIKDEFNPLTNLDRARGSIQSIVTHLLHPDETSVILAHHMIRSVSYRKPYFWSPETHGEAVRYFLGSPLTDALGVEGSLIHRLYFYWVLNLLKFVYFLTYTVPWGGTFPKSVDFTTSHPVIQRNFQRLQKTVQDSFALSSPTMGEDFEYIPSSGSCPFG